MTISEFKAWFEGYTEGHDMLGDPLDVDRIREKLAEVVDFTYTSTPISIPTIFPAVTSSWDLGWNPINCNDVPVTRVEWPAA